MMQPPEEINTRHGPPPAPVETKNQVPPTRPGMQFTPSVGNRPDLAAGRNTPMFRESGIDLQSTNYSVAPESQPQTRREMRGPQTTDLDHLLSGLKTKQMDFNSDKETNHGDDSMISVTSLRDLQNTNFPKKSKKRQNKSDKNMVSLDI